MAHPTGMVELPYIYSGGAILATESFVSPPVYVATAVGVTIVVQGDTATDVDITFEESIDGTNWYPIDGSVAVLNVTADNFSLDGVVAGSKIQFRKSLAAAQNLAATDEAMSAYTVYVRVTVANTDVTNDMDKFALAVLGQER